MYPGYPLRYTGHGFQPRSPVNREAICATLLAPLTDHQIDDFVQQAPSPNSALPVLQQGVTTAVYRDKIDQ